MTVLVATQIQNHLAAVGGRFKGAKIVFVTTGGNDVTIAVGWLDGRSCCCNLLP